MKNYLAPSAIIVLLGLIILPLASADLITPGYKYIPIENKITNLASFNNFVILSVCQLGPEGTYREPHIILQDGIIPSYYKFCNVNVFAIQKSKFNLTDTDLKSYTAGIEEKEKALYDYLNSVGAVNLAEGLQGSESIPITNPANKIINDFTLNLSKVTKEPSKTTTEKSVLSYYYIIIPIVALLIIITVLIKKKRK